MYDLEGLIGKVLEIVEGGDAHNYLGFEELLNDIVNKSIELGFEDGYQKGLDAAYGW